MRRSRPEHTPCVDLLRRVFDDLRAQVAERRRELVDDDDVLNRPPFEEPFNMESSSWGVEPALRGAAGTAQGEAETDGARRRRARLEIVHTYLKQHFGLQVASISHLAPRSSPASEASRRRTGVGNAASRTSWGRAR